MAASASMLRKPTGWLARIALAAAAFLHPASGAPLTIYTEVSPPLQVVGPDGRLGGFAVEIVREIQRRTGSREPIQVVPWVRGYKDLQALPNVVLFSAARSKEREGLFDWVGPLYEVAAAFYVRKDSATVIRNLAAARKLALIGVYREDILDQHLSRLEFTNLDRSLEPAVMARKLMAGRIDALASSTPRIASVMRSAGFEPGDIRPAFIFFRYQLYIAFSKGTEPGIVRAWGRAFDGMKTDGTFDKIFRNHFPSAPPTSPQPLP